MQNKNRGFQDVRQALESYHLMLEKMISSVEVNVPSVFQYIVLMQYGKVQYNMQF